ncbi:MAG: type VI secretion system tip protein TssI/VgrG [Pseudomonadota bacterium]
MTTTPYSWHDLISGRQHRRLLRLTFPHDDAPTAQLLVNDLEASESLSRDFEFKLELLSNNAHLALKDMQGKLVCVALVRHDGSLRYFTGYCFTFRLVKSDGNLTFYQATLGPWLKYLGLRKNNYLFHNKTVREQTEAIFSAYGVHAQWDCRLRGEDRAMTDACQFDETDFNYVSRRWEAAGWYYWYEHTAAGHQLMLSDDSVSAAPIDGGADIRFQRHGGSLEEDGIGEWSPVRHTMPGSVALTTFDFKNFSPHDPALATMPTINKQGAVPDVESYEYAGAYGFRDGKHGDALARLRMEEMEAVAKHIDAAGNNRSVLPGRWFRLVDHFNHSLFNGREARSNEYLILEVRHLAANNYLQQAEREAGYTNTLRCLRKNVPWRPGRGYNSTDTKILAPQTATVVGPSGPNTIYTDEYGRVRVQFHWDRIGEYDERSSAWVRVASSWAGSELGFITIPRIGMEVIVQFLNGSPDRFIITGCVYNSRNMPPWKLPSQQALSGLRSRELSPEGGNRAGGRSNHLLLDDTNEQVQAQLKSDHQQSLLSLGYITRIDNNAGRKEARGEGWELASNAWGVARANQGMLITTEARVGAGAPAKDMGETTQRLAAARAQHATQADLAEQHGAQDQTARQAEVADAIKAQNDAIRGAGGDFPQLSAPHLVLASPVGIELTSAQSTHIASAHHTALTTGKSLSIASGDSLLASIRHSFRLFVHKAGMKLIAAAGDIDMQALSNSINILAKLDITHTANRITITAKEEVLINGGGSYARFNAGGIEHGTNGQYVGHAAGHSFPGAKSLNNAIPVTAVKQEGAHAITVLAHSAEGLALAGASVTFFDPERQSQIAHHVLSDDGSGETLTAEHNQLYHALVGYEGWTTQFQAMPDDDDDDIEYDLGELDEDRDTEHL